ncbi:CYFA0S17e02366g1_1 [Cyberlindnera fabianii]|uniref:CYFA0S17e02366g1_1 n=1 Tax=Cyberlindnera fabianii TaxID=36022 RepID=A0A061B5W6_CYBFA|nr:CYFA0S17e02366g1_1 [Cyberlindnera fabianii]
MAQQNLPTELLQWLFRVLQAEYIDPRTTYHDAAVALQAYPTLKPRTRVYTSEIGESRLLLNLHGSLPANIQGRTYKIPVDLWIPHEYPLAAPIAYVVPTEKMVLQPGNHVDSSGRCYLPYLASWGQNEQQSTIITLCSSLSTVFSREPPVFAKPAATTGQQRQVSTPAANRQTTASASSPQPVLPPKQYETHSSAIQSPTPSLPPKQTDQANGTAADTAISPPPLPPLPEELRSRMIQSPTLNKMNEESQIIKPTFDQPNIMDGLADSISSVSISQSSRERESASERVQSMLQNIFESDVSQSLSKFNSDANQIKYAIDKFAKIFEYEFHNLESINRQITENETHLNTAITTAQDTIVKAENFKEINTDEVICAENVVLNQLYDLVAEDQAIEDTIYALTKAHDNGLIPLNSFIKHTRNLAREQFMKKALVVKIADQLGMQQ